MPRTPNAVRALILAAILLATGCTTPTDEASTPNQTSACPSPSAGAANASHGTSANTDQTWPDPVEPSAVLCPPDPEAEHHLGWSVAIEENTLIAGAPEDDGAQSRTGEAHVYERAANGTWTWQTRLEPDDAAGGYRFGQQVVLANDTAAIAAPGWNRSTGFAGAVYLFERSGGAWTQSAKLVPEAADVNAGIGEEIAFTGDRIAFSATTQSDGGVFVFEKEKTGWRETANLAPSAGWPGDWGIGLAVDSESLVAGGLTDDEGKIAGSAVHFERDPDGAWNARERVHPPGDPTGSRFGWSIELDGETLAVGAISGGGTVHVYEAQANGSFTHEQALGVSTPHGHHGRFGHAVELDGDRLLVGDRHAGPWGSGSGSAYLYERAENGTFAEVSRLSAPSGFAEQRYGYGLALGDPALAVGAPGAPGPSAPGNGTGAVYVYDTDLLAGE